jgi:hypothetical protein
VISFVDRTHIEANTAQYLEFGSAEETLQTATKLILDRSVISVMLGQTTPSTTLVHTTGADFKGCFQKPGAVSIVGMDVLQSKYNDNRFRSILLPDQPFAVAGDTSLTSVIMPNGRYVVRVDRLFGNSDNEYTMINVVRDFPALPPAATPSLVTVNKNFDAIPTPYAFSTQVNVAFCCLFVFNT